MNEQEEEERKQPQQQSREREVGAMQLKHLWWDVRRSPSWIRVPSSKWASLVPFAHSSHSAGGEDGIEAMAAAVAAAEAEGDDEEPLGVMECLDSLKNFEKEGVPRGAGTESDEGFDLQRMSRLLSHLGDPLSAYPVVHVAGTKGKGSTVAFISNILRAAGFRVGSYTSPHIRSLRERIVSGTTGQPISSMAFNELYADLQGKINEAVISESGALTHFEVLTALAFAQFAKEHVDLAVIEAGLGGARDATNVIPASSLLAAVIVGIGKEHLEALGGSLESIAVAKAGIIKYGRPVILGKQKESRAEDILRQVAVSRKALVLPKPGHDPVYSLKSISAEHIDPHQYCDFSIRYMAGGGNAKLLELKDVKMRALGAHQLDNAVAAIQTALCLRFEGWKISDSAIRLGVESTRIPGRFQLATRAEALQLVSNGATVVLDGAHTEGSAAALADTLRKTFPRESLALVVAMASDKDHLSFARTIILEAKPRIIITTQVEIAGGDKRAMSANTLAELFNQASKELNVESSSGLRNTDEAGAGRNGLLSREGPLIIEPVETLQAAIKRAAHLIQQLSVSSGAVCITGSLHAVSGTLKLISTKNYLC